MNTMSQDNCAHCLQPFQRYRNRKNQKYCRKKECQKARKAKWKREKIKADDGFRKDHKQADKDWHAKEPGYWKRYRIQNPEKTERNRILQRVRNQKRRSGSKNIVVKKGDLSQVIAKVDLLKASNHQAFNEFWLVPVIAKVDVLKAHILLISEDSSRRNQRFF